MNFYNEIYYELNILGFRYSSDFNLNLIHNYNMILKCIGEETFNEQMEFYANDKPLDETRFTRFHKSFRQTDVVNDCIKMNKDNIIKLPIDTIFHTTICMDKHTIFQKAFFNVLEEYNLKNKK